MRGHLVEQIKIIHFGGGQVKWVFSNQMKPFNCKFMCIQESQLFQVGQYSYCYKMLGYFTLRVGKKPGIRRITIYMCRSGKYNIIHYADQL